MVLVRNIWRTTAMFGGLHIKMALWSTIGDFLKFRWTTALCEAEVASSGTADSFLRASHLTRTRHSYQIIALTLSKLQHEAWESMISQEVISFECWKKTMISKSPTFQYWNIVLEFEILFIRSHRQNTVCGINGSISSLVFFCFRPC